MTTKASDAPVRGIEVRQAHFPGRAPVDAYGNGGFRFADMSHRGSILCLPSGIYGWSATVPDDLTPQLFDRIAGEDGLELLLIGTGSDIATVPDRTRAYLAEHGVRVEVMATGAAARTFNVLLAENRPVGAALLAVD